MKIKCVEYKLNIPMCDDVYKLVENMLIIILLVQRMYL